MTRGRSVLARLVCTLIGFPGAGTGVPVSVRMQRRGEREVWERTFDGRRFRSVLSLAGAPGTCLVQERFGPFRFQIALRMDGGGLLYPVRRGTFLGLPLPRLLLPRSDTIETDRDGKARFDVAISLPRIGDVVRYQGTLSPVEGDGPDVLRDAEPAPCPPLRA